MIQFLPLYEFKVRLKRFNLIKKKKEAKKFRSKEDFHGNKFINIFFFPIHFFN